MSRPRVWPHFSSPLRSTAVTARLGRVLGIFFGICFVTGMLSHYQYHPWGWLPEPASPVQAYRLTQGLHVATGVASIPLLLAKLWSVYPNLFRWPPIRSIGHAIERLSVFVLVATAIVQLTTGFLNTLDWYPWPWSFASTHRYLAYVLIGSILVHLGIKLPDIKYGLQARLRDADVLTEIPWSENPLAHSNAGEVAAARDAGPGPARAVRRRRVGPRRDRAHHHRPDRHPAREGRPPRDPAGVEGTAGRAGQQDRARRRCHRAGPATRLAASRWTGPGRSS